MDVEGYIDRIEQLLADARPVPLSASVMMSRRELEEALEGLRGELPDELRQARWILKERDDVIEQGRRHGEQIVEDAQREADRILSDDAVSQRAEREAEQILAEAREQAKVLRLEAEDYVDAKLANFETALHRTLQVVQNGRERLGGGLDTHDLADDGSWPAAAGADPDASDADDGEQRVYDHESGAQHDRA